MMDAKQIYDIRELAANDGLLDCQIAHLWDLAADGEVSVISKGYGAQNEVIVCVFQDEKWRARCLHCSWQGQYQHLEERRARVERVPGAPWPWYVEVEGGYPNAYLYFCPLCGKRIDVVGTGCYVKSYDHEIVYVTEQFWENRWVGFTRRWRSRRRKAERGYTRRRRGG